MIKDDRKDGEVEYKILHTIGVMNTMLYVKFTYNRKTDEWCGEDKIFGLKSSERILPLSMISFQIKAEVFFNKHCRKNYDRYMFRDDLIKKYNFTQDRNTEIDVSSQDEPMSCFFHKEEFHNLVMVMNGWTRWTSAVWAQKNK